MQALNSDTAANNTGLGEFALYSTTTGTNSGLGYSAGYYISTGTANTAIGADAAVNLTTGGGVTAIGTNAMVGAAAAPLTGQDDTAVGYQARLSFLGTANANTAIGMDALAYATTAGTSTAVGA